VVCDVFSSTFRRQNNVVKNWQLDGGPLTAGAPYHGTTGTVVNLTLGHTLLVALRLG